MKYIYLLLVFVLIAISNSKPASAHVLKVDGSVGAVIHVTPEDDPIANQSTDFYFEFKDKSGTFSPQNCDCRGVILQKGKEIYSDSLFKNSSSPSLENASFAFTFPEKDIYKVQVVGKPTTSNAFEPFTLSWDIRVARVANAQASTENPDSNTSPFNLIDWSSRHRFHIIGGIFLGFFFIYALLRNHVFTPKIKK